MFSVVWYMTKNENKHDSDKPASVYIADTAYSAWYLWHSLKESGWPHVEVRNLEGMVMMPEKGVHGVVGFNF